MSIHYAILGLLGNAEMTGYDLKKIMQESSFMHWSGNNNQIYKALLELSDKGFVVSKTQHQEKAPSKKVYTITGEGMVALKKWLVSPLEAIESKKPILTKLCLAHCLGAKETHLLLDDYAQSIRDQLAMEKEKMAREALVPTTRKQALRRLCYENLIRSYELELKWIEDVRAALLATDDETPLADTPFPHEENAIAYEAATANGETYILLSGDGVAIESEQDALDIISICAQHDTRKLLISNDRISDAFLRLGTGIAGAVLQKLGNYGIQTALIIDTSRIKGKFADFAAETKTSPTLRIFPSDVDALVWLFPKWDS